jgi:hypothetical protein
MRTSVIVLLAAAGLSLAGCAQPPQGEIDAVDAALKGAEAAGAADYAPDALKAAHDAKTGLDVELRAQGGKFALMRSYADATKLATAAKEAADRATQAAATGKAQAKAAATDAITAARASLQTASELLAKAPRGKGTAQDIEAMKSDLTGVETTIGEADAALSAERFKEASTKAGAARTAAEAVTAAVQQAMAARARR